MVHERFTRLAERVTLQEPPCMSDADDWESNNRWIDDLVPTPEPVNSLPTLPDAAGEVTPPPGFGASCRPRHVLWHLQKMPQRLTL